MKLTKQTEAAALEAYLSFWEANLSADMVKFASYLVDDFSIIGSANGEEFFNKQDAVAFYTATADEMSGKAQLRNRNISVQPADENSVVVREQCQLYVLIDNNWTFYGNARISCVIKYINNTWMAVHQHASFPDHRTEPGQQLAAEKIQNENLELREAVQRRTIELEQKNRELEIEAAVERVRAQSMAMQQTSDIAKVTEALYLQLTNLKIKDFTGVAIYLVDEEEMVTVWDLSSPGSMGDASNYAFKYDPKVTPTLSEFIPIWRGGLQDYFVMDYPKEKLLTGMDELEPFYPAMAASFREAISSGMLEHQWNATATISHGILSLDLIKPPTEEVKIITLKMAAAFNLAYQRFDDLQKAEKQNKEAQIELSLERVRAKSLAMHTTTELQEVIDVVHKELLNLNIAISGGSFIAINSQINNELRCWGSGGTADTSAEVCIPVYDKPFCTNLINRIKKGPGFFTEEYSQEEKKDFFTFLFQHEPWSKLDDEHKEKTLSSPGGYTRSCFVSKYTSIFIINHFGERFSMADNDTLQRFGKVFEQAYSRFLDLQKAEAQTRAAQIELAVERVRAKALAMHSSTQILDVVATLRNEMLGLEIPGVVAATIYLQEEDDYIRMWDLSSVLEMKDGFQVALDVKFKLRETDPGLYMRRVWNNAANYFVEKQEAADMAITLDWLKQYYPEQAAEARQFFNTTEWSYLLHPTIQLSHGKMSVDILDAPPPPEMESILVKMGGAFDLAYKRFLDLQQSEKQIKEAQVELALERVRARSLAMHKSEELADLSLELVKQVQTLGVATWFCAFNIYDDDPQGSLEWGSSGVITYPKFRTPREHVFLKYYEAGHRGETFLINTIGEDECPAHYEYLCTLPGIGDQLLEMKAAGIPFPTFQIDHVAFMKYGYVLFITYEPMPEAHDIFIRFAKVFEQTYIRFLDLQKAEEQAREAQIEAALEKVRSRSLAMQKSEELKEVIQVVYEQFVYLNVNTEHTGFVIDYKHRDDRLIWVASKHGVPSQLTIPYFDCEYYNSFNDAKEKGLDFFATNLNFEEKNNFYRQLFTYIPDLPEEAKEFYFSCPGLSISTVLLEDVALYIENFEGSTYSDEDNAILMRFGKVFQQTYTRFLDLQKAEALAIRAEQDLLAIKDAKQKAEEALTELQVTQKQLIQSEKMASLGELTAGIAHEIQNPLNFVNNFSEVSKELLDELREAMGKGDAEEANEIMNDVIQNLEKINHHGKRADGIVKGMLQHSRSSSGEKELTDISVLADEYLRLAYHGLRAKDKSFNAKLVTEYDENISKINIIPQDMGRVILNLITNAFYVVDEKKKSGVGNYEPTVSVSTKKIGDNVEIKVSDNGNGIPSKILDKIFQPFFTTKPTGQGTGLGLSLAYDIVKAHGGELRVNTTEGAGTIFTIQLQANG